jgi:hypothetical protein
VEGKLAGHTTQMPWSLIGDEPSVSLQSQSHGILHHLAPVYDHILPTILLVQYPNLVFADCVSEEIDRRSAAYGVIIQILGILIDGN